PLPREEGDDDGEHPDAAQQRGDRVQPVPRLAPLGRGPPRRLGLAGGTLGGTGGDLGPARLPGTFRPRRRRAYGVPERGVGLLLGPRVRRQRPHLVAGPPRPVRARSPLLLERLGYWSRCPWS